jgi:cytochrome c peroxidase
MRVGGSAQGIRIRRLSLSGMISCATCHQIRNSTQLLQRECPNMVRSGAVDPPDQPHGITTHQSGHRTLVGVRVAFNTISCS